MTHVTENTINDLLADYLRKKGLPISNEYSGKSIHGRNQPDFCLSENGCIFGEGEWESSFMRGLKQAHDFSNLPGATGSFVIGYPEQMKIKVQRRLKDSQNPETVLSGFKFRGMLMVKGERASLFHGELTEVCEWLKNGIVHKHHPENPEAFISIMRDIVEQLTTFLPTTGDYPTFFEHIIATMPRDAGELDTARRAAAYLLLNQVVFYRILSQNKYHPLNPDVLEKPADIHKVFFERVLEDDYAAVFNSDVASLFPEKSLPFIKDMITYVNQIQPESFTRDLLGSIFHELIPKNVRKSVAAFYTNPEAARLLAKLTIDDPDAKIADFSCGSGTLLMAAYDRKAELLGKQITEDDHKRFLEKEITGCDIMPFAAHLAVVQLALRQPLFMTDKVRVAVQDSTSLKPGVVIAPLESSMPVGQTNLAIFDSDEIRKYMIQKGAISGQGKGHMFKLDKLDATLMNPPFTRKQLIGSNYRKVLTSHFQEYSEYESKEQSFFGYFVFLADRFLKPGGRMGFVLPSTSIRQASSEGMRKLIRDRYDLEYLILSGYRMAFSEDAAFSEILLIAKKRKPGAKPKESFILATVKERPSLDNIGHLVSQLKDSFNVKESSFAIKRDYLRSSDLDIKIGLRSDLESTDWLALLPGEENIGVNLSKNPLFTKLVEIIGNEGIIQGIRFEGSSNYVNVRNTIISKRREAKTRLNWEIVGEEENCLKVQSQHNGAGALIPLDVLKPAVRTPSGIRKMNLTNPFDYAVNDRFPNDDFFWDSPDPNLILEKRKPHLTSREGKLVIAGRNHIGLTSDGTYWVAFSSEKGIVPTWSFWSVKMDDPEDAKILCLWLNSSFSLSNLYDCRIIGTGAYIGWLKPDILQLYVPDVRNIDRGRRRALLDLYDSINEREVPPLIQQISEHDEVRMDLDLTLAKILGISEFDSPEKMITLYNTLTDKLRSLDQLQKGDSL